MRLWDGEFLSVREAALNKAIDKLQSRDERISGKLTRLFRLYGYEKYRMGKFESYEVYLKNKDYIDGDTIVTFTDSQGKLLALRPDVTLSIVNNLTADNAQKKYYYDENVFRRDKNGEYREQHQIGVEYIGGQGVYPECEAVTLALKSLSLLNEDCVLCVGNLDAVEALTDAVTSSESVKERALELINTKSFHELKKLFADSGADEEAAQKLISLLTLEGNAEDIILNAEKLTAGTKAERAVAELKEVFGVLAANGLGDKIKPDFSIIEDLRYYDGIVFCGYVRGAANAVISGGRYDSILRRMGKPARAVGFAIDADAAENLVKEQSVYDVIVIGSAPAARLYAEAEKYVSRGLRTLVLNEDRPDLIADKRVFVKGE